MTKSELERIAVLENELEHISASQDEMKDAIRALSEKIERMHADQQSIFDQVKGGKIALAGVVTTAGAIGAAVTWGLGKFLPFLTVAPR